MRFSGLFLAALAICGPEPTVGVVTPCLADAIPASARKLLGTGLRSYPLGIWVNDWPAGHAMAAMMAIIIEEAMGYAIELKGPGVGTPDGFFAVAGCRNPTTGDDPQCDDVTHTLVHVNVEGGCRWLNANTERWQEWLPDQTSCFAHVGLFDKVTERFVLSRMSTSANIVCRVCPAGHSSEQLKDDRRATFIFLACPPGTSQASGGMVFCDPCPAGQYQGESGSQSCMRCGKGTYQDLQGQPQCKLCPEAAAPLDLAASLKWIAGVRQAASTWCACWPTGPTQPALLMPFVWGRLALPLQFQC
eukprot:s282_g43.t1